MGLGVILDVPISLSSNAIDVLVDFVVIPCTSPLLLGAPFMETYGAFFIGLPHHGAVPSPALHLRYGLARRTCLNYIRKVEISVVKLIRLLLRGQLLLLSFLKS